MFPSMEASPPTYSNESAALKINPKHVSIDGNISFPRQIDKMVSSMLNSLIRAIFQNSNNSLNKWIKTLPNLIYRSNNFSPFPASCFQRTPVLRSKFNMPFQVELELVFHHWKIRDTNFVKKSIALTFTRFSSLEKRNG